MAIWFPNIAPVGQAGQAHRWRRKSFRLKRILDDAGRLIFASGEMGLGPDERSVVEDLRNTPEKVEELITRPTLSVNPGRDITPQILRRISDAAAKEMEAKDKKPKEAEKK